MIKTERAAEIYSQQSETGDEEGTYEKKKDGDKGNQTVFVSKQTKTKVLLTKKTKSETAIYTD